MTAIIMSFVLCSIIMGCNGFSKAPQPITRYTVNYTVSPTIYEKQLPIVIKLDYFGSAPEYATNHMIYADKIYQRNAYVYHQWISPPTEMVTYALAKDFKASHAFSAVTFPGDQLSATHVLSGSITDFYQRNDQSKRQVVLGISVLLFTQSNHNLHKQILLEKQYTTEATCKENNAAGFAVAMNTAIKSLSKHILEDIYKKLTDQLKKN